MHTETRRLNRFIGLAHEAGDEWWQFDILLGCRKLAVSLWTIRPGWVRTYWYNKEVFDHWYNNPEGQYGESTWFIGIQYSKTVKVKQA